jgi:hypothetical protein
VEVLVQNGNTYDCTGWCGGVNFTWLLQLTINTGYTMEDADLFLMLFEAL